jgi:hypothetical protein
MSRIFRRITIVAAGFAMFGAAAPLSAQEVVYTAAKLAEPPDTRAAELRGQAEALLATPGQWRRAARLLERSADLRDASDPEAYASLRLAGRVRAAELRGQAEALLATPGQWRRAARLLERSADLRDASDPEAYAALRLAGRVRAAVGDLNTARYVFEKAAEHALARGAVFDAAHAFIDAAHAAAGSREPHLAKQYVERAALLATSPQLSARDAAQIRQRIRV